MNRKMIFGAAACLFAATAVAERLYTADDTHRLTPIEIDLASPLQLPQWSPFSPWRVYGLRLDLVYGRSFQVYGIDIGASGYINTDMYGIEATGFNLIGGNAGGIQVGCVANSVRGTMGGVQASCALNWNHGEFGGVQASCVNINGVFYGVQAAVLNWNSGICYGTQAGFANVNVNEYYGTGVGVINIASHMHGCQIGVVNEIEQVGDGLQIGVINGAKDFKGVQIGLFNVIQNSELPIMTIVNAHF